MKGIHDGDLIVTGDEVITGIVRGNLIIRTGATATIKGMVEGDVLVEDGAMATVSGMVSGRVVGTAEITGMVG